MIIATKLQHPSKPTIPPLEKKFHLVAPFTAKTPIEMPQKHRSKHRKKAD